MSRSHADGRPPAMDAPAPRARSRRSEQRHLVTVPDEPLAQQGNDRLDPSVAGRRNGDPRRRQHRDPQRLSTDPSSRQKPDGRGRGVARPARNGYGLAPHSEPLRLAAGALLPSGWGTWPSRYSSAAGRGEENIVTATRARARHRGQCSTVIQGGFGLMLSPQRGQFRNDAADSGRSSTGRFSIGPGQTSRPGLFAPECTHRPHAAPTPPSRARRRAHHVRRKAACPLRSFPVARPVIVRHSWPEGSLRVAGHHSGWSRMNSSAAMSGSI